jgi:DNA-binding transcriptional LysR family regulator
LDLQKLLYLAEIVEQGSLKKAAKSLRISQPALSKSMDRLEGDLGMKLLHRGPMGVMPTVQGAVLYSHAKLIREEMELAEKRLARLEHSPERLICFGTLPSLGSGIIPLATNRWLANHANVPLRLVEKAQIDLLVGLLRGDFDFIVANTDYYDFLDGLRQRVLFRDHLQIFCRPKHPLFEQENITWADLAQFPWISPMTGAQRTILHRILISSRNNLPLNIIESNSIALMRVLLAESNHLAMLPEHAISCDVGQGRIRPLPITDRRMSRNIALICREGSHLDRDALDLVECVEKVGLALCHDGSTKDDASVQG